MKRTSQFLHKALLFILLMACTFSAAAQQANNKRRGVEAEFTNKRTESLSNEVSSNVLRIKNNSENPITFFLNVSTPDGWAFVSKRTKAYTIEKFDSLFIPINLTPKKVITGNVSHIINASLVDDRQQQFASTLWYMSTKRESNWNASVVSNKIFFLDESDTAHFTLKFQNLGNAVEDIKVNFSTDRNIKVFDTKNKFTEIHYYNLKLPVNSDTSIVFNIEKAKPLQQAFREDIDSYKTLQNDYFPVRVIVQNQPSDNSAPKTWRSTIDFIRAGTETKLNEYRSPSLPLIVEANVDNFLDNSTMLSLSMYGNADLTNNRSLIYRYQTFFVNNFYSYTPYLGNSHYIGYFTPKVTLEVGDVSGDSNLGFTPTGRGLKGTYRLTPSHMAGAFYLRSPGFFNQNTITDYGFNYEFRRGTASFENFVQFNDNTLLNTTGYQYSNRFRFILARAHSVILSTAYSSEEYLGATSPMRKNGFAYGLNYSGSYRKLNFALSNTYGSPYNIGYRGIKSLGADIQYRLSNNRSIGADAFIFHQNPEYFSSAGLLLDTRTSASEQYQLKYTINKPEYNVVFKYQHLYNEIFNLRSESDGLGFDFRPRPTGGLRFFLSVIGAYNRLLDYNIDPYFSSQVRTTLRYKGLTTNVRYYYGPYQTFEQILFANSQVNNQSLYTNTNIRLWLIKDVLTFEPSVVYSYETLFKRHRVSLRPEVYYVPKKSGLEVRFYGQYINNSQKNNPFIDLNSFQGEMQPVSTSNVFFGLGVKKRIGVPVAAKKFPQLTISVFKDLNGNGKQDKNEPGLKNVLVNIKPTKVDSTDYSSVRNNSQHLITDDNGKILYKNLPKGEYLVKIVPLTENSGFFAGNEQIVNVEKDKDLLMPLNEGVQLTGVLVAERDPTSANFDDEVDLSKIRVIAIDSLGKSYTTLTEKDGRFSLRMPAGVYQININEKAIPENFDLMQKFITVDMITVSDNYNITFVINEKKRKISIKKFDSKGNVLE